MSCFINSFCQPFATCLATSFLFNRTTLTWCVRPCSCETPDFIAPGLWPANSPDLNPVDYYIWMKLQERVYRSQIHDVDQLKSRLIEEWEHFHQVFIDEAIRQWRPRRDVFELAFEHAEDILNTDFVCA